MSHTERSLDGMTLHTVDSEGRIISSISAREFLLEQSPLPPETGALTDASLAKMADKAGNRMWLLDAMIRSARDQ